MFPLPDSGNLVELICQQIERGGDRLAIRIPDMDGNTLLGEDSISWRQLGAEMAACQHGLQRLGLAVDDQVVVVLKPGLRLYTLTLALLASGMVPIFVDPGMGLKKVRQAMASVEPKLLITYRHVRRFARWLPELRKVPSLVVDGPAEHKNSLAGLYLPVEQALPVCVVRDKKDIGLITFTSGSTGAPKGSNRTHYSLIAQHFTLQAHLPASANEIEMPCLPVLVIHNLCNGVSSILPRVSLNAQAAGDGMQLLKQMQSEGITRLACAPAFLDVIAEAALARGVSVPTLHTVAVGGATVPAALCDKVSRAFPQAQVHIVYGSTEAEPISSITVQEWYEAAAVSGYRVGPAAHGCEICIANLSGEIATEEALMALRQPEGKVGEVLVSGEHVLDSYYNNDAANAALKIPRAQGGVWHRTGDCGYLDDRGQLVLTGRLGDRLHWGGLWLDVYPVERRLDQLPGVQRSALIQAGQHHYVFLEAANTDRKALHQQVSAALVDMACPPMTLIWLDAMPVDGRHNSKIDRPLLRERAARYRFRLRRRFLPVAGAHEKRLLP